MPLITVAEFLVQGAVAEHTAGRQTCFQQVDALLCAFPFRVHAVAASIKQQLERWQSSDVSDEFWTVMDAELMDEIAAGDDGQESLQRVAMVLSSASHAGSTKGSFTDLILKLIAMVNAVCLNTGGKLQHLETLTMLEPHFDVLASLVQIDVVDAADVASGCRIYGALVRSAVDCSSKHAHFEQSQDQETDALPRLKSWADSLLALQLNATCDHPKLNKTAPPVC